MDSSINLYQIVQAIIREGHHHNFPDTGSLVIDLGEDLGLVDVARNDGCIEFWFNNQERLFRLGKDNVLVERVSLPSRPKAVEKPHPPSTIEEFLRHFVKIGDYPEQMGESVVVEYGEDEQAGICVTTRVKKGVIADFITEKIKLFYDFTYRVIRRYEEEPPPSRAKQERLAAERRKQIEARKPIMVTQLGYDGKEESVNRVEYCNQLVCECGNVRWIKSADLFQVRVCKPCAERRRKRRGGR